MKILFANFAECPENLHFEQAFIRAVAGRAALDIVHDFRFHYSFIERLTPPGGGARLRCGACAPDGRYDVLLMLDFPKRKACAAQCLRLLRSRSFQKKIFVANHLLPMPGHNPTADIIRKLSLMDVFNSVYILEFDDGKRWVELGAVPANIRPRGYAVDCRHYRPLPGRRPVGSLAKERGYIFSAGSAGRDFAALAEAVSEVGLELRVFSDSRMPDLRGYSRAKVSTLSGNLHNLRDAVRGARAVAIPLSDRHMNGAAGNSIAFLAMACARPVVTRRTPYFERFIKDGISGFFYPSLSSDAVFRQLERALALGPAQILGMGRAARASVLKRASLDVFARDLAAAVSGGS